MPGSGETRPNPVFCAMPTQPDHTSAAAGAARTSSGQDRTVRSGPALAPDRSAADRSGGPAAGTGPRRPGSAVPDAVRGARRSSHGDHHPSVGRRAGWGSPVSAASAVATSERLART